MDFASKNGGVNGNVWECNGTSWNNNENLGLSTNISISMNWDMSGDNIWNIM